MDASIDLRSDITVARPIELVRWYWKTVRRGPDYYGRNDVVTGNPDAVEFGDLAWAVLLEGRPSSAAAQSLLNIAPFSLCGISGAPLCELDEGQRATVVDAIVELTLLPGFGTSVATKVLHVKRRKTVPVLDNRAVFGSFMQSTWQLGDAPTGATVTRRTSIEVALNAVHDRMVDPASRSGWRVLVDDTLSTLGVALSQIELFDICWWAVLRADGDTHRRAQIASLTAKTTDKRDHAHLKCLVRF